MTLQVRHCQTLVDFVLIESSSQDRNITTQAESQNLILQLNKKTQEMSDLRKEKSSLEAIIKDLQVFRMVCQWLLNNLI